MAYRDNWGGKTGSGAQASDDLLNVARRERLRALALDVVDLKRDPYLMRNHLGSYECKLCLTLHSNEGNYLAHTQGRRHQTNLARRTAREAKIARVAAPVRKPVTHRTIKIGRPAYRVTKQRDPYTQQFSLLFQITYPQISNHVQPKHRFMSTFEQKKQPPDNKYQYFLVAAEPYETIAFRIPNLEIDRSEGKFVTHWDREKQVFTLQLFFVNHEKKQSDETNANGNNDRDERIHINDTAESQAQVKEPKKSNPFTNLDPFSHT